MSLAPRTDAQPRRDGATLAARDTSAFGQLYTEHFEGLYDFAARIVRDSDLAAEIVQSTFTKAWDELRAGRELTHPKAWLYAVARNQALDELRRRQRLTDEPLVYAQPDPSRLADPQAVAEDNELIELVWTSAAALKPEEYSLLDLHVRHGFGASDLADALDLERGAVYTRLSRLRSSLEESVASTLLIRRGLDECPELAAIVAEHNGDSDAISPQLRRAVRAHVKDCDVCRETRRKAVSSAALFGAFIPIVPVAGVQQGILASVLPGGAAHAAGAGAGAAVAGGGAAVAGARQGGKAKYIAGASGIAAAAAIVAVALTPGGTVRDPSSATSLDHSVGVASADRTVSMRWQPGKHAQGYSVAFSRDKGFEPPARENVKGTQYTSAPLGPGRWWFILRSHGKDGGWTHTLRVGPFVITAALAQTTAPRAAKAKAAAKRATHGRAPPKTAPQSSSAPAPNSTTTTAAIVPGARAAPPAPRRSPATAPPKPRPNKPRPPRVAPPPANTTPPAAPVAPPVTTTPTPPAATPVIQTPPVSTTPPPPPPPPPGQGDDDDHGHGDGDGDGDGEGEGEGGEGHGHGHGHGNGD
jgi:RNA polymerase sigma factor (sigma-70 family)